MTRVLVAGGTGHLGRLVVQQLSERGADVRILSRKEPRADVSSEIARGDLVSGSGLNEALDAISVVVHCAHDPKAPEAMISGTKNLVSACQRAGVSHLVYISIAGIDDVSWFPYYAAKLQEEQLIEHSGIAFTTLRAAQFHDLALAILRRLDRTPVIFVPWGIRLRPIAIESVASRLTTLALGSPLARCRDLVGPETKSLRELARSWLATRQVRKLVVSVPSREPFFRALRSLTITGAECVGPSWADWLSRSH